MNQEYQKWKILFVDGKSTTKHKKFIKEYCKSDSRFKIIEEKGNSQGIYKAMNLGLKFIKKIIGHFLLVQMTIYFLLNHLRSSLIILKIIMIKI